MRIINCDNCSIDLSHDNGADVYMIKLKNQQLAHGGGDMRYDIMIYPPLDRDYHFCGIECLKDFVSTKLKDWREITT